MTALCPAGPLALVGVLVSAPWSPSQAFLLVWLPPPDVGVPPLLGGWVSAEDDFEEGLG